MHTVFALLCFVVVIHWLIFPYPSGLLHWHCGNLTIAPVPAKQPWWIWINTSCEFIMNDCITTTKQSTTKPCAYFLGYTVHAPKLILRQTDGWIAQGLVYLTIGILPPNLTKSRSNERWIQSYPITLKFDSHLISSVLVKTQSDTTLLKNISRFYRDFARSYKKQGWPWILCKRVTGQRDRVKIVMYNRWRFSIV